MFVLQNGNLCESLKDKKDRLVVLNTCGFDSIIQLFAAACTHEKSYNIIMNSPSDIFKFITNFVQKGPCKFIYKGRATQLRKIDSFVSTNLSHIVTINAVSNVNNLCERLLTEDPSYTLLKNCKNCKKQTSKNFVLLNLDFETILEHGYSTIVQAIDNYVKTNHTHCKQCNKQQDITITYHSHLVIECIEDPNVKIPLKTFPKIIELGNESFTMAGIVHYIAGENSSVGHYTAYALYGEKWILFDDLLKKSINVTEETIINPVVCMYVKVV